MTTTGPSGPPDTRTNLPPRRDVHAAYRAITGSDAFDARPLAAQLVNLIWRHNNGTVEHFLHAEGPFNDADMLRHNALLTWRLAELLDELPTFLDLADPDVGVALHRELQEVFVPDADLAAVLDNIVLDDEDREALRDRAGDEADELRTAFDSLSFEVWKNTAKVWIIDGIPQAARARGWDYALKLATWRSFSLVLSSLGVGQWWGCPRWEARVDALLAKFDDGPDPTTLRDRLVNAPWELSDEQAQWVVDHRYGGPHEHVDIPDGAWPLFPAGDASSEAQP